MYEYSPSISMNDRHYTTGKGLNIGHAVGGSGVLLPAEDLAGHMLVTGKTGSGKSSFVGMVMEQLSEREGCNIILLDPHGKLAEDFVVANRSKELVYISPRIVESGKLQVGIQMNGIIRGDGDNPENSLGWVRELFSHETALSNNTWGPRLELIFRSLLSEMVKQRPDSNLSDLAAILTNQSDLRSLLRQSTNVAIREFLEMQMKDWRNWNQYVSSALNKLLPIISSKSVSTLISSRKDSFDLKRSIESGNHAFVIEISKTTMPEDTSRILTSIFLQRFWSEYLSIGKSIETYVIVDECQLVESNLLERLLSEGRKYGLRLILITQSISLLGNWRRNAILSNVRNFVSFPVSDDDAQTLSRTINVGRREMEFVNALKNQELHRAIIWSQGDSGISGPLSFSPVQLQQSNEPKKFIEIINGSILKFGSPFISESRVETETGRHSRLIRIMEAYLSGKKIPLIVNQKVNSMIPDGLFTVNGTEYILEAECSDLDNFYRIFRKIKAYQNRKVVFLTYAEDADRLFQLLTGAFKVMEKRSAILEIPIYRENDTIYFRDIKDYLERIFIIAADQEVLKFHDGLKLRRFFSSSLSRHAGLTDIFSKLDYGEFRAALYKSIVRTGYPYIMKSELEKMTLFDQSKVTEAAKIFGKRSFIMLSDLFKKVS